MTDPPSLEPIEAEIRSERPPDESLLVIRAGPLTPEKLLEHALRQSRDYSYRGEPMASVSVSVTIEGWPLDRILRERLWSRSTYATANAGAVRTTGFELLPTHRAPHYDIVLPAASLAHTSTLLAVFGDGQPNPFRRRTR